LATGIRPGHQPSPQMSAWRVWRYIGMMQYDLRRLDATSLQWQDWCCCWMNSDMRWFKESTLPEYIRFQWLSWHVIYSMPCFFQLKLRQASEYPKWFGNIQCRAVGSAKLCKTAKGGEGVDIWDVDIKNYGGTVWTCWNYWEAKQQETSVSEKKLLQSYGGQAHSTGSIRCILLTRGARFRYN
jgi:hypothetical protein